MPKSYDDPGESDPIELSRMAREAKERAARRKHMASESTNPPPPPYRERQPSLVDVHIEEAGKRAKHLKEIWAFGGVVVLALVGAGVWANTRPSQAYVEGYVNGKIEAERKHADEIEQRRIQMAITLAKIEEKLDGKINGDNDRWNKLDKILEKQFGDTTKATPPSSFGPAAKARGKQ